MNYKYTFVKMGSQLEDARDEPNPLYPTRNRIILDVGNGLRPGVIDTHHLPGGVMVNGKQLKSTTAVLTSYPFLVLDNIDSDAGSVELVMHQEPDLDCFAAVYLARSLIEQGNLPPHTAHLADYVEQVDRGLVLINRNTISSPAAIACAIDEVLKNQNPELGRPALWEQSLKRGLEMITYIMQRLAEMMPEERSLFHPALFAAQHPFQAEMELLKNDYEQYKKERDDRDWTEFTRIRVPAWTDRGHELQEVDALFWKRPPQCVLHKHWARGDYECSMDGKGFILTFIPFEDKTVNLSEKDIQHLSGQSNINTCRTVISVNPALSFHLNGLASALEVAECEREKEVFNKGFTKWRSRKARRFPDIPWCNNEDPWYDGHAFDYTIVDAPGTGSLLTVAEIKAITLQFTKPSLKSHRCNLVIPFEFSHKIYADLVKWCHENKQIKDNPDKEFAQTFTQAVRNYLFSATRGQDGLPHRIYLKMDREPLNQYLAEMVAQFKLDTGNSSPGINPCADAGNEPVQTDTNNSILPDDNTLQEAAAGDDFQNGDNPCRYPKKMGQMKLKVLELNALIFRYGSGYIIVETELQIENDMMLEQGMLLNNILARTGKKIFDEFLLPHEKFLQEGYHLADKKRKRTDNHSDNQFIPWEPRVSAECLVFTASVIDRDSFYISETKEILYKLSGAMRWDEPFGHTRYYESIADENILELGEDVFYSFAKTGGALLVLQDDYNKTLDAGRIEQMKERQTAAVKNFYQVDFWSFLLALHQRHTLMRFSHDLAAYVNSNNKRKIAELRHLLLEFTTIGWFSQVSHNQTSMEVYRRWRDTFENASLYKEVFNELAAVDDYISMKRTRRIEIITATTLPLVVLGTIFGTNFDLVEGLPLWPWWALGIFVTLTLVWGLWYWFSSRN